MSQIRASLSHTSCTFCEYIYIKEFESVASVPRKFSINCINFFIKFNLILKKLK